MVTEDLCLVGEKYRWQPWTVTRLWSWEETGGNKPFTCRV